MAGLVPAIHALLAGANRKDVDGRDKRGHDAERHLMSSELASIAVTGRHLAGDLGALFEIAADDQVGGGRAGAVGLQVGAVAPVEMSNELSTPLA
jgi:hypothetical protein